MAAPQRSPGIDVSHCQGPVDWDAAARAGIAFAFLKATEGVTGTDARFADNWAGAWEAGIVRGAYHFFSPTAPVSAQIANFLETLRGYENGDLPPAIDLEEDLHDGHDRWDDVPLGARVGLAVEWLERVRQLFGRPPIVYTRRSFVAAKLGNIAPLGRYPLWIAHYGVPAPAVPVAWSRWTFWQYTNRGKAAGVQGSVDCDWFAGSPASLRAL